MPASAHPAADSNPLLLAIESSCDETAAAVIDRQLVIRSNIVASQIDLHAEFGGVVPEIASRAHLTNILPVLEKALDSARVTLEQITAVAVVTEPGLVGSLLVGLTAAKAICLARNLPLIPVHHIEAHLYACRMSAGCDVYPAVGLVVSGGHTSLYDCQGPLESHMIGCTIDDAAGEAFDKVARVLALGFPGGPAIEKAASELNPADGDPYVLPRARLEGTHDFSFSGLKTAVYRACSGKLGPSEAERIFRGEPSDPLQAREPSAIRRMAAGFQAAITDVLVSKTALAAEESAARSVILAGGVAANTSLREALAARIAVPLFMPRIAHCMDNGTMIAMAGSFLLERGEYAADSPDIDPSLELATDSHLPD